MSNLNQFGLMILNIPDELKRSMLWGVSTMRIIDSETGRRDKAPRNPKTGERLSVTDPAGWGTFDDAINSGYPAIGMRLTEDDPYVVIDLDNPKKGKLSQDQINDMKLKARQVYDAFDSYAEKSYSGNGVHIILKGPTEAGRRKDNIEVYSQERYIICTGNVVKNQPINDGGKTLINLRKSLNPYDNPDAIPVIHYEDEKESDHQILTKMFNAANGAQVKELYETKPAPHEDWSYKDAQLAQHICFYTRNPQQALRLFRGSALYRGNGEKSGYENRKRYEEDYLISRTFGRAWFLEIEREKERQKDNELLGKMIKENLKNDKNLDNEVDKTLSEIGLPPVEFPNGLVGDIARYIYGTAPRPVKEVAIAGAISMVSGIAGRHYNINGSGLGLYIVLLAKTGRGKEAASTGVSILMDEVARSIPSALMFRGPSHIASGQGLTRAMADGDEDTNIPSKVVILSEFGHTLSIICARDATAADMRTRQALLDFFSKNSWGSVIKESAYADKQNNTKEIRSPNLSMLGDTTPEVFFKSVDMDIVSEGFLPRFMIIEYDGPRTPSNINVNKTPPSDLITRLKVLFSQVITMKDSNQCINISMDEKALNLLREFDHYCDEKINEDDPVSECWNRAHLQALRLSGTIAVGNNIFEPVVDEETAKYAIDLVKRSVLSLQLRISVGAIGGGDVQQEFIIRREIQRFFSMPDDQKRKHRVADIYVENGFLPMNYLHRTCASEPILSKTSRGLRATLSNAIQSLISQGDIVEIDAKQVAGYENSKLILRTDRIFAKGVNFDANWKDQLRQMDVSNKLKGIT